MNRLQVPLFKNYGMSGGFTGRLVWLETGCNLVKGTRPTGRRGNLHCAGSPGVARVVFRTHHAQWFKAYPEGN